jgi:hypothetical protein
MRIETRVLPVDGMAKLPASGRDIAADIETAEARQQRDELLLLNVATVLSVALVCCAWIAIALD